MYSAPRLLKMPKLPINLLDLSALLKSFGEFGNIKKHLFKASREILLALQGLLTIADNYVNETAGEGKLPMASVLGFAQKTLEGLVQRLPHENEDQFVQLQEKVFETILSVIDYEISSVTDLKTSKAKMKQDVLNAIREVLLKEMKKVRGE